MQIFIYNSLPSTMLKANAYISSGWTSYPFAILTSEQTQGKGKQNRTWYSPPGNLYMSYVDKFPLAYQSKIYQLTYVFGLALIQTLKAYLPSHSLHLKWPNDVLINHKKVSGILLETFLQNDGIALNTGIGVNIHHAPPPENVTTPPIALADVLDLGNFSQYTFLQTFFEIIQQHLQDWRQNNFKRIRQIWLSYAWKWKQDIHISLGSEKIKGLFEDVDDHGRLVITYQNTRKLVYAGEVFCGKESIGDMSSCYLP